MAKKKAKKPKAAQAWGMLSSLSQPKPTQIWEKSKSVATTARYAFACPSVKEGEGQGIHVSMIPQTPEGGKLNFFMDPDTALRLRNALTESLDSIRRLEAVR